MLWYLNFLLVTALKVSCSIELAMHSTFSEVGIKSLLTDMITCKDILSLEGKWSSILSRKVTAVGQRNSIVFLKQLEKAFLKSSPISLT